jgi:hypothetical protein
MRADCTIFTFKSAGSGLFERIKFGTLVALGQGLIGLMISGAAG